MQIKYASLEDIDDLASVHSKSLKEAFGTIFPKETVEGSFSFERRKKGFLKEVSLGEPLNLLAYHENKPAGLLTYGKSRYIEIPDNSIELWRIYLMPEFWGKGLGKELLEYGIMEIRKQGYEQVILWVLEENKRAQVFYERNGFRRSGRTLDAYLGRDIKDLQYVRSTN